MFNHGNHIATIVGAAWAVLLLAGFPVREARGDFILRNDEQLTVNTAHSYGRLYDQSQARVVCGGSVDLLYAYASSSVDISGGSVGCVYAWDSSSVEISGGSVNSYLFAMNSSSVAISGGSVSDLRAMNSNSVDISGGSVSYLSAYDTSCVDISGGTVNYLLPFDLKRSGGERINISGGTVGTLSASITLTGAEQLHISEAPTPTLLGLYGVTVAPGTVSNMTWYTITGRDTSSVDISGGSVIYINARDSSSVDISGGSMNNLYAYESSSVDICGGSVGWLACNLKRSGGVHINISGGTVGTLSPSLTLTGTEQLQICNGLIPAVLGPYGVTVAPGTVSNLTWGVITARDTSSVDISGGSVSDLYAWDSSSVDISGGSVSYLSALNTSTVDISGGSVGDLRAYNSSTVDISGGSVSWLYAYGSSSVTFLALGFGLGEGLSLDGDRLLGTGYLSGEWDDGSPWGVDIFTNASTITIRVIPEPATLGVMGLGLAGVLLRRRRNGRCPG